MRKQSITVRQTESLTDDLDRLHDLISRRAYDIFLSRGVPAGTDLDNWLLAEQELVTRPEIEVRERDGHLELDAVLADLNLDDLDVRVAPQDILIRSSIPSAQEGTKNPLDRRIVRGLFGAVHLPQRIDPSTVEAEFRSGMLHVTAALAKEDAVATDTQGDREP